MSYLGPKTSNLDPVINYISNGRAYSSTIGWATYADAAGAQPVDGTGGSPNVTWSRDTTTPLRQGADFNFVKDAVNRQGQGVSYDFTIDNADLAKVLTVTFDYEVVSGTFATGDVTVYLIQDPSGTPTVVQPAGYQIQSATVGTKMRQIATFQTSSTVTSYRLCLHVSSVSASAYTLAVDNVVVGPQVVQYGAPVTDWQDYTFTIGATTTAPTFGTTTVNKARYRRVGDSMEISWQINQTSAGTAGSGNYLFPLPSGFSIDTAKLTVPNATASQSVVGTVSLGTASVLGVGTVYAYDSTRLQAIFVQDGGGVGGNTWGSSYIALNNTLIYGGFTARVPILGWSSTVQMSNDTDTRVVAAKIYQSSAQALTAGAVTKATNMVAEIDSHGAWNSGTARWVAPVPGYYRVSAVTSILTGATTERVTALIYKNGSVAIIAATTGNTVGSAAACPSGIVSLNAGDYLELYVSLEGASRNTNPSAAGFYYAIERLSGPSAIAASETVAAKYYTTAGPAINNTSPAITYGTKVYDTHNAMSGSTYTIPVSGKYRFTQQILTANTAWTAGSFLEGSVFKNGAYVNTLGAIRITVASTTLHSANGSSDVDLVAGDQITFRIYSDNASTLYTGGSASGYNYVTISRIGN